MVPAIIPGMWTEKELKKGVWYKLKNILIWGVKSVYEEKASVTLLNWTCFHVFMVKSVHDFTLKYIYGESIKNGEIEYHSIKEDGELQSFWPVQFLFRGRVNRNTLEKFARSNPPTPSPMRRYANHYA